MIARTLMRLAGKLPGVAGDLVDWYDEMRDIAEAAAIQRAQDEAADPRDKQDMARWLREPDTRRPRPEGRHR